MDLRKKLLMKVPLHESSFNNSPNTSIYESAGEDSDSDSMYFSFTSTTSVKEFDTSYTEKDETEPSENQNNKLPSELESSPTENKDITVIMMDLDATLENSSDESKLEESNKENMGIREVQKEIDEPNSDLKAEPVNIIEENNIQADNAVLHVQTPELADMAVVKEQEPLVERAKIREPLKALKIPSLEVEEIEKLEAQEAPQGMDVDSSFEVSKTVNDVVIEASISSVQILIQDPNENIVNPFTFGPSYDSPVVTPTDTAALFKGAKKSFSKIPTRRSHLPFYSPCQRASIDRKTKIVIKPTAVRRTIYETRSAGPSSVKTQLTKSTSSTKLKSVSAPKPSTSTVSTSAAATKPVPLKPKVIVAAFKCTFLNCNREFRSGTAYQAHLKTHNSSTSSVSSGSASSSSSSASYKCKWCDKNFEVSMALTNHLLEACKKIPFGERRKLAAEQEKKKPLNNKRKSMFIAPQPLRKKSPSRRQTIVGRKSGVVTPKKTMKCHVDGCGQLFTNVLDFANHMVSHKYDGVLPAASTATKA